MQTIVLQLGAIVHDAFVREKGEIRGRVSTSQLSQRQVVIVKLGVLLVAMFFVQRLGRGVILRGLQK